MNKLFYPKLAGQNIIKNGKFYFPYLLTVVASAAAFYIMTTMSYYGGLPQRQRYDFLTMFMSLGSVVLAVFVLIIPVIHKQLPDEAAQQGAWLV